MAKPKTVHVCSECGGKSPRWQGQCPHCQAWNTLVESVVEPEAPVAKRFAALAGDSGRLQTLADIRAIPRDWLHYAQVCDATTRPDHDGPFTVDELIHTARAERLLPGEGEIDLGGLFAALPADEEWSPLP